MALKKVVRREIESVCDEAVMDKITEIVEKIQRGLSPEKIILFGSFAQGMAGPHSDIDLLVIWDTPLGRSERLRHISRLIKPRPAPLDIVVRTPEEIEKARHRVDPFLHEILAKGIAVYARPS